MVVISITAASVGITLTKSSHVVLAELVYSPELISQAIDRCHRIGQDSSVLVSWCLAKGSCDEKIQRALVQKINTIKRVIG